MSLLRHIRACNAWEPARFLPFRHGPALLGLIRRDNAELLRRFPKLFKVGKDAVNLIAEVNAKAISAAIDRAVEDLVAERVIAKWRNEFFAVAERWGTKARFTLDRGAVPFFGVRAYGVHLNGYRRARGRLKLWIGKRASNKIVAPGKLDNMVAGGIGVAHGLEETLWKEAAEEAAMPRKLSSRAVAVGAVSYRMETRTGLRNDVLFLYDVETPDGFTPRNTDGELVSFALMDAEVMVKRMRDTEDFKFNVNLVNIDFVLRHGVIRPDDPDYLELVTGLHRPID
jgi:hypothetical protein